MTSPGLIESRGSVLAERLTGANSPEWEWVTPIIPQFASGWQQSYDASWLFQLGDLFAYGRQQLRRFVVADAERSLIRR